MGTGRVESVARWTEAEARQVFAEWRASELSMRAFASSHGIRVGRLAWWRARLGEWDHAPGEAKLIPAVIREQAPGRHLVIRFGGAEIEATSVDELPVSWLGALARELGETR